LAYLSNKIFAKSARVLASSNDGQLFYIEKTTFRRVFANNSVFNLHFMKVSTENDNNFGYEKITNKFMKYEKRLRKEGKNMFGLPIKQNICKFNASLDA
jgi:hypothetical protein